MHRSLVAAKLVSLLFGLLWRPWPMDGDIMDSWDSNTSLWVTRIRIERKVFDQTHSKLYSLLVTQLFNVLTKAGVNLQDGVFAGNFSSSLSYFTVYPSSQNMILTKGAANKLRVEAVSTVIPDHSFRKTFSIIEVGV